jgi:antitoxin (DNA-binding transcriptional repressor) of toxin-antitoxin stability system
MDVTTVDVQELVARWAEIVSQAEAGADVIVTEGNVPRALLLPLGSAGRRVAGLHAGAIRPADDFDAPLPDDFWTGTP